MLPPQKTDVGDGPVPGDGTPLQSSVEVIFGVTQPRQGLAWLTAVGTSLALVASCSERTDRPASEASVGPGTDGAVDLAGDGSGPGADGRLRLDAPVASDATAQPDVEPGTGVLPEGNNGIAARYPGDVNIASDPQVIFADDFESYANASGLSGNWDAVYHSEQIRIATEAANVHRGSKALEFTVPQQSAELSNTAAKVLGTERDILFLRYHSKFSSGFDVIGSSHNGGGISAHYYINGQATPGVPANGTNKFLANFENWRGEATTANPGELNIYIYHPDQRSQWGDHFFPSGTVLPNSSQPFDFGPTFVARPEIVPELGRWYGYEFMVKANTPGQRDGRIACWLDGALIADFPNLRLRDVDTLKIDRFAISLHIGSNTAAEAKKWYDNVVAATSYIGPVVEN